MLKFFIIAFSKFPFFLSAILSSPTYPSFFFIFFFTYKVLLNIFFLITNTYTCTCKHARAHVWTHWCMHTRTRIHTLCVKLSYFYIAILFFLHSSLLIFIYFLLIVFQFLLIVLINIHDTYLGTFTYEFNNVWL